MKAEKGEKERKKEERKWKEEERVRGRAQGYHKWLPMSNEHRGITSRKKFKINLEMWCERSGGIQSLGKVMWNAQCKQRNYLDWSKYSPTSELRTLGISRLCSATFEQLLAFWATLCSTSNLGQLLPSLATFEQQIDIKPIQTIKGRFISKDFIKTGFIKTDFIKTKDIQ